MGNVGYKPTLTYVQGDLIKSDERVIAHGCNCQGLMGAGIAKQVRQAHPIAYEKYMAAIRAGVFVKGYAQKVIDTDGDRIIYNLATQVNPGADGSPWAILLAFCNMFESINACGISRVAIPKIGAGIARLDWEEEVLPAIERAYVLCGGGPEIVVYSL